MTPQIHDPLEPAVGAVDVAAAHLREAAEEAAGAGAAEATAPDLRGDAVEVLLGVAAAMQACCQSGLAKLGDGSAARLQVARLANWTLLLTSATVLVVQTRPRPNAGESRYGAIASALGKAARNEPALRTAGPAEVGDEATPPGVPDDWLRRQAERRRKRGQLTTSMLERQHRLDLLIQQARRVLAQEPADDEARHATDAELRQAKAGIAALLKEMRELDALDTQEAPAPGPAAAADTEASPQIDHAARRLQVIISARCIPVLQRQPGGRAGQAAAAMVKLQFGLQATANAIARARDAAHQAAGAADGDSAG